MVLAAIARERQDGREAAEHYFAAALISDNRTLAELASEISRQFNLNELGLQAAELWQTLSPNEVRVHQFLGIFRLRSGDFDGAVAEFGQLLAATENHACALAFLVELLANEADTQTTTAVMAELICESPGTPEGHDGLARLRHTAVDFAHAL